MPDSWLEKRLPTLLAQIVSVIFAVLVALAVDEYWEERENAQLAARTMDAVAREIRANRAELADDGGLRLPAVLASLDSAVAALQAGRDPGSIGVTWKAALLTSAAWETARVTRAAEHVELDRVVQLAQLYEMQRLYTATQDRLMAVIEDMGARMHTDPVPTLLELKSRIAMTTALRQTLGTAYACGLVKLEGADVPEATDCPDPVPEASGNR